MVRAAKKVSPKKPTKKIERTKRVVVLGGGFGGVRAALRLDKLLPPEYEIVLVDKKGYHLPQWMLYETATVHMTREQWVDYEAVRENAGIPLSLIFKRSRVAFLQAEVKDLLLSEKKVALLWNMGDGGRHLGFLDFEYAVLALGGETNYFNIPGMKENALSLKGLDDALNVRNAIEELCSRKKSTDNIQIVVGGGGFTGVEFAAELVGYMKKLAAKYHLDPARLRISIVEASGCLLPGAKEWIARATQKRLRALGITIVLDTPIERYLDGQVFLKGGKIMPADLLVWTAGVRANSIMEHITGAELSKTCLVVNDYLQIAGHEGVYGIGDNVFCFNKVKQCAVPATAQRAIDQANVAATNIARAVARREMVEYEPHDPVFVVPLGGKYGLADLSGFGVEGFFGWALKMTIGLTYLLSILPIPTAISYWWSGLRISTKND